MSIDEMDLTMMARSKIMIAGPCSVESEGQILETALQLQRHKPSMLRGGIWKPRTRPGTFEGVGAAGLAWLKQAGDAIGVPVTTEVARTSHIELCLRAGINVLWIGARTTTNPFAVQELAEALRGVDVPVLVKNPMSPDADLWIGAIERISRAGVTQIAAVHRGFCVGSHQMYRNEPMWTIPIELRRRLPNIPILTDPSHICGTRIHIATIAAQAMKFSFDGLMVEVHYSPKSALSDAPQQLTPAQYGRLARYLRCLEPGPPMPGGIDLLRHEIELIDSQIIGLVARRIECTRRLRTDEYEYSAVADRAVPHRYTVPQRLQASVRRRVSERFARDLFAHS